MSRNDPAAASPAVVFPRGSLRGPLRGGSLRGSLRGGSLRGASFSVSLRGASFSVRLRPALLVAVLLAVLAAPAAAAAQVPDPSTPCAERPEARQFDFWIGTWDVYDPAGDTAGVNIIEPALDHCLLIESWTGARGSKGTSMNFYDPQRATWRQVWMSDRGTVLDYRHGEYRDAAMRFSGITIGETGDTILQKLTFVHLAPDTVRQIFQASTDHSTTWDTTWIGLYVRRPDSRLLTPDS